MLTSTHKAASIWQYTQLFQPSSWATFNPHDLPMEAHNEIE